MLSLAILAVPATVFYNIAMETRELAGNPVTGDRFNNDLNPQISRSQLNELTTTLRDLDNVNELEVNLRSATLRVNILTPLDITDSQLSSLIDQVKNSIFSKLPQETYFTATPTTKQYDIEIHIRNTKDVVDENYRYVIVSKTSLVTAFRVDEVSVPRNPEFVAQLNAVLNPLPPEESDDD